MKRILLGALCAAATLATVSSADAAGGCGVMYHRDVYGHCRLNPYGRAVATTPGGVNVVVGSFDPHRGYWDGHRYWWHRYNCAAGWCYR
jgi:hypothetical protein